MNISKPIKLTVVFLTIVLAIVLGRTAGMTQASGFAEPTSLTAQQTKSGGSLAISNNQALFLPSVLVDNTTTSEPYRPKKTPRPKLSPTPTMTYQPTLQNAIPTATKMPTLAPTNPPAATNVPTLAPTIPPVATTVPTQAPTAQPTATKAPTLIPTAQPTATKAPTLVPTAQPTAVSPSNTGITYYIAPTGCSDSNTGRSATSPWCTIQKAANLVNPGDGITLKGGVYKQYTNFNRSGAAGMPITIQAVNGEIAVLDGSNIAPNPADPWNGRGPVMGIYASYLTFRNLDVTKSAVHGIVLTASYDTFYNVSSHDNWSNGLGGNGSYNLFEYCKFYNNKGDAANAGNVDGLAFSSGGNNTFRYSEAYGNSDDGFDMWRAKNNLFEYNSSHDNGYGLNGAHGDGNGYKLGGNDGAGNTDGGYNTVRFNVAYSNWHSGFDTNLGAGNQIYNNTAYMNYRSGSGADYRTFSYTNTFKNNISFGNRLDFSGPYVASNNTWNLGIADPRFASTDPASSAFLRLASGSPAIDKGANVGMPYSGAAPDLGAYEYP